MLIPPTSNIFLYGKGVFTTIAVVNGKPFLWEKHFRRLEMHAAKLGLDLSDITETMAANMVSSEIEKNGLIDARLRITLYEERSGPIWPGDTDQSTRISIITADRRTVRDDLALTFSPYTINSLAPLAGLKTCNYLDKIMALDEAKARGFDEAIQVNERGLLTSAVMANVFWLIGDRLYTPSLATGCLAGTTREYVLENIECDEVEVGIEALNDADAIFLTSAGLGVRQVAVFGAKKFEKTDHPVLTLVP